jgi:outer membrane receptor protein involved in Fe transport
MLGNYSRCVFGCGCLLLAAPALFYSQTVDTAILGTIADASGGLIVDASVTVTQSTTGIARSVKTNSAGNYEVRYLIPGSYSIEVQAPGFLTERRPAVDLQIGQQAKVDFSLQVGTVQQTVEVHSTQPLLQTENASLAGVVGQERIENLPLNGRKFDDLALLTPGVRVGDPDLHTSSTTGSTIAGNGGRIVWGQVNVDGATMVNNRHAYVNIYPSVDAVQEFKVQTGNYSAEYGGNAGTNVNIQIKSGSNQFHGDLFEFFRNQDLDARNFFRPAPLPKNILKQNQFGATLGGPIAHDKTFFFASYEGIRSIQESPGTAVVLTPSQRNGIFTSTVTDPLTGLPFANNQIPASRINPVSQSLINRYTPLPNASGSTNYAGASLGDLTVHQGIARVDHYFGPKDSLFVHYIGANRNFPDQDLNPFFRFTGTYPATNISAQYIHTFTPALVNEFRAGINRENVSQLSVLTNTSFTIESLGINGMKVGGPNGRPLRSSEEGFPLISISGYLGMGDDKAASNLDNSQTYQLVDNISYIRGKHILKAGADIRKLYDNATTNNTPFGSLAFTSDIAGNAAAAYMLGFPRTTLTPEGVPITKARQWRIGAYAQDDWKLTPNLTINAGLRYDLFVPPKDVNAVTRTLDFSQNPPIFVPAPGQILNDLWHVSYKDFSPRVGFAWNPIATWVVRGGYGIFYYGGQFDHLNILQLNPPTAGSLTITNPSLNPIATIQNPIPAALYPANPFFNAVSLPQNRNHPDLYAQDWNLTISKQFGNNVLDVAYVGNKGTHLDTSFQNYNQPSPGPGVIQSRRPYPTFARIRLEDYGANSNYNSLQIHWERRLSKGLSFTLAYAWSHEIDTTANEINGGGCGCQDPRHRDEPASGLIDQRHNLVIGYVWKLPLAQQAKGLVGAVAGGWSFEGLISFTSGNPFDINESSDTQNDDGIWERPNLTGQSLGVANQGPARWFNINAFTPSILMYGNSPRNPVIGPGTSTLNLSLAKEFRMFFSEAQKLQFRAEGFNALNTPQFSNPDAKLGDVIFGQITSTKSDNRVLQFALKYLF